MKNMNNKGRELLYIPQNLGSLNLTLDYPEEMLRRNIPFQSFLYSYLTYAADFGLTINIKPEIATEKMLLTEFERQL